VETSELFKRVKAVEIKTRGLSNRIFSGEYHSAFKGRGMAFAENREYTHGDEIRTIDWNVTARMGHPYVKVFEEERELTVMILADVSASQDFGSREALKRDLITELTAVLAFSAIQNNDKIGVVLFSDTIEKFIPPKKGRTHILRIIRELIDFKPKGRGTDISGVLDYLNGIIKKRCICFVLSDFIAPGFEKSLRIANRKHDMVALKITDPMERVLPDLGLVLMTDPETGEERWVDTGSRAFRLEWSRNVTNRDRELQETFRKCGVDVAEISPDCNYINPLVNLFKRR
jgi:uncharacterized protein (DUF58 family)